MSRVELSKNEQDVLDNIRNITKYILDDYDKLISLEKKGEETTLEYQKYLHALEHDLGLEENLYQLLGTDYRVMEAILNELNNKRPVFNIEDDLNCLLESKKDLITARIERKISSILLNNPQVRVKSRYLESNENYVVAIMNGAKNDLLNTLLMIINECLNKEEYRYMRDYLCSIKYYLAFLNSSIESDLIDHEFRINPEVYLTTKLISSFNNVPASIGTLHRYDYAMELYSYALDYLIDNYRNIADEKLFEFMQIVLRTSCIFLDKDYIENSKRGFMDILNMGFNSPQDMILHSAIASSLSNYENDKEKINEMTFKLN